jgi:hypothetical protein
MKWDEPINNIAGNLVAFVDVPQAIWSKGRGQSPDK